MWNDFQIIDFVAQLGLKRPFYDTEFCFPLCIKFYHDAVPSPYVGVFSNVANQPCIFFVGLISLVVFPVFKNFSIWHLVEPSYFLDQFYVIAKTLDNCVNWELWTWRANRCIFRGDACWPNLHRL